MSDELNASFHAMADPARRSILRQLATGSASVGALAEPLDMTAPAVSHHLKVLERAGLVSRRVDGQTRMISLAPDGLLQMESWFDELRRFWTVSFDNLDQQLQASTDAEQG